MQTSISFFKIKFKLHITIIQNIYLFLKAWWKINLCVFQLLLHHVVPGAFTVESLQDEMTGVSLAGTQLRVNSYTTQDIEWNDVKVSLCINYFCVKNSPNCLRVLRLYIPSLSDQSFIFKHVPINLFSDFIPQLFTTPITSFTFTTPIWKFLSKSLTVQFNHKTLKSAPQSF